MDLSFFWYKEPENEWIPLACVYWEVRVEAASLPDLETTDRENSVHRFAQKQILWLGIWAVLRVMELLSRPITPVICVQKTIV